MPASSRRSAASLRRRDFLEVDTPALQVSPGIEPHLMAFATELDDAGWRAAASRYLHTSPEFAMKKLLVAGLPRIFQLAHVFRNGERGATHHPEFTMLEWYRADASYRDLMADCETLLRGALAGGGNARRFTWAGPERRSRRRRGSTSASPTRSRATAASTSSRPRPIRDSPSLALLAAAARPLGIAPHPGDDWEDLFFRIFLERIEPHLGWPAPTILYDYPMSIAALARPKPGDPRLAERFELYVCGLELANAFGELTDAATQRARFEADARRKRALYGYATRSTRISSRRCARHAGQRRHRPGLRPPGHAGDRRRRASRTCSGRRWRERSPVSPRRHRS